MQPLAIKIRILLAFVKQFFRGVSISFSVTGVRVEGSSHADFPQRGKSAPIQPSLFSPSERNHARSGFIGAASPSTLTPVLLAIHHGVADASFRFYLSLLFSGM